MSEDLFLYRPRMAEYMTAQDLNTEGCLYLAETVLAEASHVYANTAKEIAKHRGQVSRELLDHLETQRRFFRSRYFGALSMGVVNGDDVIKNLDQDAGLEDEMLCAALVT